VTDCRRRADCRLCGSDDLGIALSLTPTPPANAFVPPDRRVVLQSSFPLDVFFCRGCGHIQLLDVVDPEILFRNYVYVSGTSPVFVDHFRRYADDCVTRANIRADDLVVEIGSNDGTLLGFFKQAGACVLGIDPARDIAAAATSAGIETWNDFFSPTLAQRIRDERGPATLIAANNVLAHIDDLASVIDGVALLLDEKGMLAFEVSYFLDVFAKTLFDTIYHEHLDYHTVGPLVPFFAARGLRLFRAERVDTHGGSVRCFVGRANGPHSDDGSVATLIASERAAGLHREQTLRGLAARIDTARDALSGHLRNRKKQGATIVGYGAPAKATTLMHHFGLGPETLDYIIDDNPLKQGLLSPGLHIPVVGSGALYEQPPDDVVILAWNFAEPIMRNHRAFAEAGGRFIVPLPQLELYDKDTLPA
jgi:hypothetical protein